jgi:acetyl esterase
MPLDPQARALLDQLAAAGGPDLSQLEPEAGRQMYEAMRAPERGEEMARVENLRLASTERTIRLRVYAPSSERSLPALVYFHGGGWVIGSLETHDHLCRALARAAGCAVVSVDYRLAPEHPYPAAVDDCLAAVRAVVEHAASLGVDPLRIAVAGDSAGGNLAAVVSLLARDAGGPPLCAQVLIYPVTDFAFDTASYGENGEGYLLTRASMEWFRRHYLGPDAERGAEPAASPLRAANLAVLPRALVITAEFDPLRDEGEAYAERLRSAGVPTRSTRYPGAIHDFVRLSFLLDQGKEAIGEIAETLREAFQPGAVGAPAIR